MPESVTLIECTCGLEPGSEDNNCPAANSPLCTACGWRLTTLRVDDMYLCSPCCNSRRVCVDCDEITYQSWASGRSFRNGNWVCDDHADGWDTCVYCGLVYQRPNVDGLCEHCAELLRCVDCDDLVEYPLSWNDELYCESCYDQVRGYDDDDDESSDLIHYYSYTPDPEFHGEGPVYLGFELELNNVSNLHQTASYVDAELGAIAYMKEDASLDHGFEIVTHPMSHEYAIDSFPWDVLEGLAERNLDVEDAGLHVHVSRAGFSGPTHVYRWLKLLYRNDDAVTAVARRYSATWAPWRFEDRLDAKKYCKGVTYDADRYSAVNVRNRDTFEVRVFASSLDATEVKAALDLVDASVEYTRQLSTRDVIAGGWTWEAFLAWTADRPEYEALNTVTNNPVSYRVELTA